MNYVAAACKKIAHRMHPNNRIRVLGCSLLHDVGACLNIKHK